MALGKCVECGREVSTWARKCLGCGRANPTLTVKDQVLAAVVLLGVVAGLGYWWLREPVRPVPPVVTQVAPPPAAVAPEPEPTAEETKRFENCRDKLKRANSLRLLYDIDWKVPGEPRVLVGPTFFTAAIDVKEGLAETISCFINGGRPAHAVPFDLRHWRTGEPVYRFSGGRLEKL